MESLNPLKTASYDYNLPKEFIAEYPITPRSSAKMLVYDRKTGGITHSTVSKIKEFLPEKTVFIINNTKVIKARVFGKKHSGGKIECIVIKPIGKTVFLALIRGKVRVGDIVNFDDGLSLRIEKLNNDGTREVIFLENQTELDFSALLFKLDKIGHIPLPPYIHREDNESDGINYQSSFAKHPGSVAAPTASLHFDKKLLDELKKYFAFYHLTLHVGLGTFKSVEVEDIEAHEMHSEYFQIPDESAKILDSSSKVLCIGTTATRTVEYYARTKKTDGECDIFINVQNPPQRADMILTNFHLPKSTLIMLVAGFLGLEKTLQIYEIAKQNGYRFYSYGDAMLII